MARRHEHPAEMKIAKKAESFVQRSLVEDSAVPVFVSISHSRVTFF